MHKNIFASFWNDYEQSSQSYKNYWRILNFFFPILRRCILYTAPSDSQEENPIYIQLQKYFLPVEASREENALGAQMHTFYNPLLRSGLSQIALFYERFGQSFIGSKFAASHESSGSGHSFFIIHTSSFIKACGDFVANMWRMFGQTYGFINAIVPAKFNVVKNRRFVHLFCSKFAHGFTQILGHNESVGGDFCPDSTGPINTTTNLSRKIITYYLTCEFVDMLSRSNEYSINLGNPVNKGAIS